MHPEHLPATLRKLTRSFKTLFSTLSRRRPRRRLVSLVLVFNLLLFFPGPRFAFPNPAVFPSKLFNTTIGSLSYEAYALKSFYSSLLSLFSSSARQTEDTTRTRSLRVRAIEVSPDKRVGYLNEQVGFAALGKDSLGDIVQGARFDWSSSDERLLRIDDSGQATLIAPGLVWVTASSALASSRVPVLIRPSARSLQTDEE